MAKKKDAKPETKSDFLRRVLAKDPDLDYQQVLRRWAKAGHPGEISNALYYQIRAKLGIKTEWVWVKADEPAPRKPTPAASGEIYQLKITLTDSRPPIWRRIRIADGTLEDLHYHIQAAMGWTNSHLHQFRVGKVFYGEPMLAEDSFGDLEYEDSTTTLLRDILPEDNSRFRFEYEYDFGDGWMHEILFEGRSPARPGEKYPTCVEGAAPARPRTWAGCGVTAISWRQSPTPTMSVTRS